MPRRYSDYPDAYTSWNILSTMGSMISFIAVVMFIFILWESMSSNRPVLFSSQMNSSVEWVHNFPPAEHTYNELILII